MASPIPKSAATRQRTNRTTTAATLEAAPATRIDLPQLSRQWHRMTLSWWETVWASPLVAEWVDADVPGLVALARLVDAFWTSDQADAPKIHAEIRMASREFGLSPLSRRSLQWEIKRLAAPMPAPSAPVRRRSGRATLSVLSGRAS
jgi:hypothetical protein